MKTRFFTAGREKQMLSKNILLGVICEALDLKIVQKTIKYGQIQLQPATNLDRCRTKSDQTDRKIVKGGQNQDMASVD